MKSLIIPTLLLLWGLLAPAAMAGVPTDQIKVVVDEVLTTVGDESMDRDSRVARIKELIATRFDFEAMSRRVLGKEWKQATEAQQQEFIKLFKEMLSQTYVVAIEEYTDEEIQYVKETIKKEKYAQVDTLIVRGSIKTPVNYRMYRRGDADWYVYDVLIEGVSLVNNYRGSYPSIVARDGMDSLLKKMSEKVDCNTGTC